MDIILWIVIGVFVAFVVVALVFILKLNSKSRKGSEIHISGGANIERGYLSNDNNYFKGGYDVLEETLVVGNNFRSSSGEMKYVVFSDLSNGRTFSLHITDSVVLGRTRTEGVFALTSDPAISKRHCKLSMVQGALYVEDLGSANHTFVNSRVLTSPCRLNDGDILKIGNTNLRVGF